jgi:hypothetical protein
LTRSKTGADFFLGGTLAALAVALFAATVPSFSDPKFRQSPSLTFGFEFIAGTVVALVGALATMVILGGPRVEKGSIGPKRATLGTAFAGALLVLTVRALLWVLSAIR